MALRWDSEMSEALLESIAFFASLPSSPCSSFSLSWLFVVAFLLLCSVLLLHLFPP